MKKTIQKYDSLLFYKLYPAHSLNKKKAVEEQDLQMHCAKNDRSFAHTTRLKDICRTYEEDKLSEYTKILQEQGVLVLKNFVPRELALRAGEEFIAYLAEERFMQRLEQETSFEHNDYLAQRDYTPLDNRKALEINNKPVFQKRAKNLEVFGLNKGLIQDFPNVLACYAEISQPSIKKIILNQAIDGTQQRQLNVQYQQEHLSLGTCRFSNLLENYKVALYLKDCTESEGPAFTYVPKSQDKRTDLKRNIKWNSVYDTGTKSRHAVVLSEDIPVEILAEAGTLIIFAAHGVHAYRGGTSVEKQLTVLVDSYD